MAVTRQERINNLHANINAVYERLELGMHVDWRDLDNLSVMITNLNRLESEQAASDADIYFERLRSIPDFEDCPF